MDARTTGKMARVWTEPDRNKSAQDHCLSVQASIIHLFLEKLSIMEHAFRIIIFHEFSCFHDFLWFSDYFKVTFFNQI